MKRVLVCIILGFLVLLPLYAFAQTAKIVDLKGEVLVKRQANAEWQKAALNSLLGKDAEVMTKAGSECTLAFDEELKRILTLKENSHIKIENVSPGAVFLPEGRVFTLIQGLARQEKFQVRTPTAIAAARGTGWSDEYQNNNTLVSCFEDIVYVEGLDSSGNSTGGRDLSEGFGIDVGEGGTFGEQRALGDSDYREWNGFSNNVDTLSGGNAGEEGGGDTGNIEGDLRNEQREDLREGSDEQRRQEEERAPDEKMEPNSSPGDITPK